MWHPIPRQGSTGSAFHTLGSASYTVCRPDSLVLELCAMLSHLLHLGRNEQRYFLLWAATKGVSTICKLSNYNQGRKQHKEF